jgi:hypothetical protein
MKWIWLWEIYDGYILYFVDVKNRSGSDDTKG